MNDTLTRLEDLLARMTELHAQLLRLSEDKRQAIVEGNIDQMEGALVREQELILEVEAAEAERQEVVESLRGPMELGDGPLKLQTIIDKAEAPQAERLATVHRLLREVVDKLRYRSRQNAELMKASMEHVEAFLRAIAEACAPRQGYGRDGLNRKGALSLLDRSA